jgi:hypothetical protein
MQMKFTERSLQFPKFEDKLQSDKMLTLEHFPVPSSLDNGDRATKYTKEELPTSIQQKVPQQPHLSYEYVI